MDAFFLTCCVRGMEVTRPYTTWQAAQIVAMLATAVAVAGLLVVGVVLHRAWRARMGGPPGEDLTPA